MSLQSVLEKIDSRDCIIEVFGLGYVGFPLSVRLAMSGFSVVGIDKDSVKIERLKNNILHDFEQTLKNEFAECCKNKMLTLSTHSKRTDNPRIAIICVPTPIPNHSTPSNVYVMSAVEKFLSNASPGDVIIIESSIEVGTTDQIKDFI